MDIYEKRFLGADGIELVGDVGGDLDKPPVILLHGGGQTRHSWNGAMRALVASGHHVINLDARGHGASQWAANADYSIETLARDLEAVIGGLTTKPVLVGASIGASTSLWLLGRSPAAASAVVLVDYVPHVTREGTGRIRDFMRKHTDGFSSLDEAAEAVRSYNPHRRAGSFSGLMKNLRQRSDGRLYWHWDPKFLEGLDAIDPSVRATQFEEAAYRVTVPALLIRGMRSDVVSDEGVAKLQKLIPHLEVFNVPDASHMVAGDQNDSFNEGVFNFLRRLPTVG